MAEQDLPTPPFIARVLVGVEASEPGFLPLDRGSYVVVERLNAELATVRRAATEAGDVLVEKLAPLAPEEAEHIMVALYTFEGEESEGTISITEGELVEALEPATDDGWRLVKRNESVSGFVPVSYIKDPSLTPERAFAQGVSAARPSEGDVGAQTASVAQGDQDSARKEDPLASQRPESASSVSAKEGGIHGGNMLDAGPKQPLAATVGAVSDDSEKAVVRRLVLEEDQKQESKEVLTIEKVAKGMDDSGRKNEAGVVVVNDSPRQEAQDSTCVHGATGGKGPAEAALQAQDHTSTGSLADEEEKTSEENSSSQPSSPLQESHSAEHSSPLPVPPPRSHTTDVILNKKRSQILFGLLKSEQDYVGQLLAFRETYVADLERGSMPWQEELVARPEMAVVLSTLEQIVQLNSQFLDELHRCLYPSKDEDEDFADQSSGAPSASGPPECDACVGRLFCDYGPLLRLYVDFISSSKNPVFESLISKAAKKSESAAFFSQHQGETYRKHGSSVTLQGFNHYLMLPVDRLQRYPELVEALLSCTAEEHRDRSLLEHAFGMLKTVRREAVEAAEAVVEFQQLLELGKAFRGLKGEELVQKGRKLVRHGPLQRMCRRANKMFYFHLFTDVLTYSDRSGSGFRVHHFLPLHRAHVEDIVMSSAPEPEATSPSSLSTARGRDAVVQDAYANAPPFSFKFLHGEKSFIVSAATEREKQSWITDLSAAVATARAEAGVSAAEALASVAPVWVPDRAAPHCFVCKAPFRMTRRRHHCRLCGAVVCAACSHTKRILRNIRADKPVRVCDACVSGQSTGSHTLLILRVVVRQGEGFIARTGLVARVYLDDFMQGETRKGKLVDSNVAWENETFQFSLPTLARSSGGKARLRVEVADKERGGVIGSSTVTVQTILAASARVGHEVLGELRQNRKVFLENYALFCRKIRLPLGIDDSPVSLLEPPGSSGPCGSVTVDIGILPPPAIESVADPVRYAKQREGDHFPPPGPIPGVGRAPPPLSPGGSLRNPEMKAANPALCHSLRFLHAAAGVEALRYGDVDGFQAAENNLQRFEKREVVRRLLSKENEAEYGELNNDDPSYHPGQGREECPTLVWKRQLVLEEILSTEKQYVRLMSLLQKHYIEPLLRLKHQRVEVDIASGSGPGQGASETVSLHRYSGEELDSPDVAVVFRSVSQIVTLNSELLERLEQRLIKAQEATIRGGWRPGEGDRDSALFPPQPFDPSQSNRFIGEVCVGDLFDIFAPLFRMYSQYATCHAGGWCWCYKPYNHFSLPNSCCLQLLCLFSHLSRWLPPLRLLPNNLSWPAAPSTAFSSNRFSVCRSTDFFSRTS